MAIKLNVSPQLGGNAAIGPAAEIPRAFGQMGKAVANPVNLPQENAGAIASQMQQAGVTTAAVYNQIGNTITGLTDQYIGLLKAEDSDIANRTYEELKVKRAEISAKNEQEVLAGRMTYGELPKANRKAYDALHNETLANLKLNLPKTADDLNFKLRTDTDGLFVNDMQYSGRMIAKQSIDSYNVDIDNTADILKNGPRGLEEYNRKKQAILNDPRINVLGPDVVTKKLTDLSSKAAGSYLTDLIKTSPDEYMKLKNEGALTDIMNTFTPEEIKLFDESAITSKASKLNAAQTAFNKASETVKNKYLLDMSDLNAALPTEAEIRSHTQLNDSDKVMLIGKIQERAGLSIAKINRISELDLKVRTTGGLYTLTPAETEDWLQAKHPQIYENGLKTSQSAFDSISQLRMQGVPEKALTPFIRKTIEQLLSSATMEEQKAWSDRVNQLGSMMPDVMNSGEEKKSYEIALRMKNFGETYQQAVSSITNMTESKALGKDFNESLWDKNSAYKKPAKFIANKSSDLFGISIDEKSVSPQLTSQYIDALKLETQFGGTQEEISTRAVKRLNLGVYEIPGGEKRLMRFAPKFANDQIREKFDSELKTYMTTFGIEPKNAVLQLRDIVINNGEQVPRYVLTDRGQAIFDKSGDPVTIMPDVKKYAQEVVNDKAAQPQVQDFKKKNPDKISRLNTLEYAYPSTLGKNKGILLAIMGAESAFGRNVNSPAGAKGPFQFMDETAKQYGVVDPYDFGQSSAGAAKYMDTLLKQYNGNLDQALMAYNWGPTSVNNWIQKGSNPNSIPKETRNYLSKVKTLLKATSPSMLDSLLISGQNLSNSLTSASQRMSTGSIEPNTSLTYNQVKGR